jgi:pimeloyl-ACP methyl ester carboxylesterase
VVNEELIQRYYELIMREGTRGAILNLSSQRGRENTVDPDLSTLNQPTLIMWGATDAVIPVSVASLWEQKLANASTVIYRDLGHIPMEEDPARSAADVLAFLQPLAAATTASFVP